VKSSSENHERGTKQKNRYTIVENTSILLIKVDQYILNLIEQDKSEKDFYKDLEISFCKDVHSF